MPTDPTKGPAATSQAPGQDAATDSSTGAATSSDASAATSAPSSTEDQTSVSPSNGTTPNGQHSIPDEHPRPAENPCRIDPTTGLPLPQEQQPAGASESPSDAEGLAQDGSNDYDGSDDDEAAAEVVEEIFGEFRDATRHDVENALHLIKGAEKHMRKILNELNGK